MTKITMTKITDKVKNYIRQEPGLCIFIAVTALLMFASIVWVYHVKVLNAPKVYSDGFGYYLYLPAVIHGDFSFGFAQGWEHPVALKEVSGWMINKYPVGVAILESPFFFFAHVVCLIKDALTGSMSATGYSNFYQYMVLFGGILYWVIGTVLLYRLLERYLGFSKKVSLLTCIVITYGTNLFHYASYDACFSHVYSYFLFNLFLFYLCRYEAREAEGGKNSLLHTCIFGFLAGLIFMCRNTNIIFVVTYIFYGVRNWETLKQRFVTIINPARAVPIVLTGMVTLFPQLLYWHTATGRWFVFSYGDESFYWFAPQTLNFLFSVRKGLFFWSPVLLLAAAGIFMAYKRRNRLYVGLVVFLLLIIYISSAWWSWYYGGSYGQRVAVDFMCVFAIFLASVFESLERRKAEGRSGSKILYGLSCVYCGVCIVWNLWCMTAYWYRVLPSDEANWDTIRNIVGMIL